MKSKSTLILLFICLSGYLKAQTSTSSISSYFYSPSGSSLACGDRTIIGQIYDYSKQEESQSIVFGENNKFFLEIAAENSIKYARIPAQKADILSSGLAQFLLPDTLKYGKTYQLRMISTNPSLVPNSPYKMLFGMGKLPFDVNFKQELGYYQNNAQTSLSYQITPKNTATTSTNENYNNGNLTYNIKLSDGNNYVKEAYYIPYSSSITVLPKDSINIFKIDEIINNCGVKGDIDGEATVIKKKFLDNIIIKATNNTYYTCTGSKISIDVQSKSLLPNSKLKLEFSSDYQFKTFSTIDVTLDENQRIIIDIPASVKEEMWSYYRLVSESPKMRSNSIDFYSRAKTLFVVPSLRQTQANELEIYFNQYIRENTSYNGNVYEAIVNGQKIEFAEPSNGVWRFPIPKRDTVLTFSKIVNSCGELPIRQPNITIKPDDFVFVEFNTKQKDVCQGETVVFNYKISNPSKSNDIRFNTYIQAFGRNLNSSSNEYLYPSISNLATTIDQENKTVSVVIPKNLDEQLIAGFRSNNVRIDEVNLGIYSSNNNNNNNLRISSSGNNSSANIKLTPKVKLTTPSITAEKAGYVEVPIQFTGGSTISYKLSNGQEGTINHVRPDCESCKLVSGNANSIKVLVEKNTTIKMISAENSCAIATVSGETTITFNENKPALIIDESKIAQNICRGSTIDIPLLQLGNWPEKNIFRLYTKKYYYEDYVSGTIQTLNETGKFQIKATENTSEQFMDIWAESNDLKSNTVRIKLESKANNVNFSANQSSSVSQGENTVIINIANVNSQIYAGFYGYGGNLTFTINGTPYKSNYQSDSYSSNYSYLNVTSDTLLTLNSASNSCGVVEINKKYNIVPVQTIITGYENNTKSFLPVSPCVGTQRVVEYQYYGKTPEKDVLVIQLAKVNELRGTALNPNTLRYFDVPTVNVNKTLIFTLPDTLFGDYVYRIKSLSNNITSSFSYLSYTIQQKPIVKLSTQANKNEVIGLPGANLYINTDLVKSSSFNVILNDGQTYSNYDFGVYYGTSFFPDSNIYKTVIHNYGKYFSPTQTTTYSVKSVYNQCGEGTSEGNVTIKVQAEVSQRLGNSSFGNTFCEGDSISLDLKYLGEFPKDTLMGLYLHTNAKASFNQELATFKNNPSKISVKLPSAINSGNYFVQIRKKSRSKIYTSGQYASLDSLQRVTAKLNLDSNPLYLNISTPPNISLSGSTEIFVGNSATLYIEPLNQKGEDLATSKDTVTLISGIAYYYQLNNGNKYSSSSSNIIISPLKTETFSISSIKSVCGVGKASGSATITVLPKSDQRIETIGYPRLKGDYYHNENYIYYDNSYTFCAGSKDSLDIKVYGANLKTDFSKYLVLLSDNGGKNYIALKTSRYSIVQDSTAFKILRLWFQLPDNTTFGKDYRIKGVSDDNTIFSTPLQNPITIRELPTASLTGSSQFATGEKVNAIVKLTGEAPWLISVTDKDGNFVYNGLPTKADSTEDFKNYKPKLISTNELKLELSPEKSNVYKVSKVFNLACELGKIIAGELTVNLVLANENPIQNLIQIYPNPTANQLNIDLTSLNATTVVEIFDSIGKLLDSKSYTQSQTQQRQSLDFSQYHSGVYLIKVNTDKLSQTYRIVKH